jgi:hypothetical protein
MKRLERLARRFTEDLHDLLNRTVTTGVRLSIARRPPDHCLAGVGIRGRQPTPRIVPLKPGPKAANAYLQVAYRLQMDDEGQHLAVTKSGVHVFADPAGRETWLHYDYVREPKDEYPNPHVQVVGESPALATIGTKVGRTKLQLGDVHIPVGGRRFRPTLEDVIEMLVAEQLVVPRDGWEDAVAEHRRRWMEMQVKAAVRRNPSWAAEELGAHGWTVSPPHEAAVWN